MSEQDHLEPSWPPTSLTSVLRTITGGGHRYEKISMIFNNQSSSERNQGCVTVNDVWSGVMGVGVIKESFLKQLKMGVGKGRICF